MKLKICKGDTVEVIAGNDKGQRGEVQRVIRKKNEDGSYDPNRVYVIVAGVNLAIKHQRRTGRVNTQTGLRRKRRFISATSCWSAPMVARRAPATKSPPTERRPALIAGLGRLWRSPTRNK